MKMNVRMKRIFSILLVLCMVLTHVPTTAFAADAAEETTESVPVCDCGTDDPELHAVTCAVYVAPENPVCDCTEKCTETNIWCDICGFDHTACTGTDRAVEYSDYICESPSGAPALDTIIVSSSGLDMNVRYRVLTMPGNGESGTVSVCGHNGVSGDITIPCVLDIRSSPSSLSSFIVTDIAEGAFENCTDLTSVNVQYPSDTVSIWEAEITIGDGAFKGTQLQCATHRFTDSAACDVCDYVCSHEAYEEGSCTVNDNVTHSYICAICGFTITEEHTIIPETGECICGVNLAVAYVDNGFDITYFDTVEKALTECQENSGSTLILLEELEELNVNFSVPHEAHLEIGSKYPIGKITIQGLIRLSIMDKTEVSEISLEYGKLVLDLSKMETLHKCPVTAAGTNTTLTVLAPTGGIIYDEAGNVSDVKDRTEKIKVWVHSGNLTIDTHDWTGVRTQHTLRCPIDGCGVELQRAYSYDQYQNCLICGKEQPYAITVNPTENGTVTADKFYAYGSELITLTVDPAEGYVTKSLEVFYHIHDGAEEVSIADHTITPTPVADQPGNYTFTMPNADVYINAAFTACDHSESTHETATDLGNGTHSFACTVCGETVSEAHTGGTATCTTPAVCDLCDSEYGDKDADAHSYGTDGICTLCDAEAVASLTNGETVTYYINADQVFHAAKTAGSGIVTILKDTQTTERHFLNSFPNVSLVVNPDVTLTVNQYLYIKGNISGGGTIGGTGTYSFVSTYSGSEISNITIGCELSLSGTIVSGTFLGTVEIRYGTIEGGTFHSDVTNTDGTINGGIFYGAVNNLSTDTMSNPTIAGGTFHSNVTNTGGSINGGIFHGTLTNEDYVKLDQESGMSDTCYGTITNTATPTTFTLGEAFSIVNNATINCTSHICKDGVCRLCAYVCDHTGSTHESATDLGDGTHSFTCTVCGETVSEAHTGGTATCTTPAVCDLCDSEYGEVNKKNHAANTNTSTWTDNRDGTHSLICTACGEAARSSDHSMNRNTGKCDLCNADVAVAKTTTDKTTYWATINDAVGEAYEYDNVTITLLQNTTTSKRLNFRRSATLDLNGKTLSCASRFYDDQDTVVALLNDDIKLTIIDSAGGGKLDGTGRDYVLAVGNPAVGGVVTYTSSADISGGTVIGMVLVHNGAFLTVSGGTVESDDLCTVRMYSGSTLTVTSGQIFNTYRYGGEAIANANGGTVIISGGTVSASGDRSRAIEALQSSGRTVISGGSISGDEFDIYAASDTELTGGTFPGGITVGRKTLNELLGDGFSYWAVVDGKDTMLIVADDATSITDKGDITVKATCTHPSDKLEFIDITDTTHTAICTACNLTLVEAEDHFGGEATCLAKAVCDLCGSEYGDTNPDNHSYNAEGVCKCGAVCSHSSVNTAGYTCNRCGAVLVAKWERRSGSYLDSYQYYRTLEEVAVTNPSLRDRFVIVNDAVLTGQMDIDFCNIANVNGATLTIQGDGLLSGRNFSDTYDWILCEASSLRAAGSQSYGSVETLLNNGHSVYLRQDKTIGDLTVNTYFTVPEGKTLTVNGTLTNGEGANLHVIGTLVLGSEGTIVNSGRITLPATDSCAAADIPEAITGGTVILGDKSYTYNGTGWVCTEESQHTGGTATCMERAICDLCGSEYGEILPHVMDPATGNCVNGCGKFIAVASVTVGEAITYYDTMAGAVTAATGKTATITLLQSIDLGDTTLQITSGTVTIDLNGKTLSGTASIMMKITGGDVTLTGITGSKVIGSRGAIEVRGAKLTIGENVIVEGATNINGVVGTVVVRNNSSLTLNGGTVISKYLNPAIYVYESAFTMNSGTVSGTERYYTINVWNGTADFKGGTVSSRDDAVYLKHGDKVTVEGTIFQHGTDAYEFEVFHSGTAPTFDLTKAAGWDYTVEVWMTSSPLPVENLKYDADRHTVTSSVAIANNAYPARSIITIGCKHSGGEATCTELAICGICGESYGEFAAHAINTSTGYCKFECGKFMAVASATIGEATTYYETLNDAIQAVANCTAADKATVTLLDKVDLGNSDQAVSSGVFTLDLNGKTLTGSGSDIFTIRGGKMTIADSGTGGTISGSNGIRVNTGAELIITDGNIVITEGSNGIAVTARGGTVTITGGTISADVDLGISSGALKLTLAEGKTEGAQFPGGIELINGGLTAFNLETILDTTKAAYWQGNKMIVLADGQIRITNGDVVIKAVCDHEANKNDYIYDDTTHSLTCSECQIELDSGEHTGGEATCTELAICGICGAGYGDLAEHVLDAATGSCRYGCGKFMAVASTTIGEATTYYDTLDAAITAVAGCTAADKATVKLLSELTLTKSVTIDSGVFTIDLNGKSVTIGSSQEYNFNYGFWINGGEVTFSGDGNVTAEQNGCILATGTSTIYITGGNYSGSQALVMDTTAVISGGTLKGYTFGIMNNGDLTITGGHISSWQKNTNNPYDVAAIFCNSGSVTVTGGTLEEGRFGMLCYIGGTIDLSGCDNAEGVTIFNDSGKTVDAAAIAKLPEGYCLFNKDWDQLEEVSAPMLTTVGRIHSHQLTYEVSGTDAQRTITATCSNADGKCKQITQTVTITAPTQLVYDGSMKLPTVTGSIGGETPIYSVNGDPVNAGVCEAYITVAGHTANVVYTITPASLADSRITVDPNAALTYTGSEIKPAVTVTLDGKQLTEGTDYEVRYRDNVNAGEAALTITGKGNYTGMEEHVFTIAKAAAPVITFPVVLNEITYGQELQDAKLSFYENEYGTFNWTAPIGTPNAGVSDYALDFYPSDLNNYDWAASADWIASRNALCTMGRVTVNKAPVTHTGTDLEVTYDGSTIDLRTMFQLDPNAGEASWWMLPETGDGTIDEYPWTYKIIKSGTFTVEVRTEATANYAAGSATAKLTVRKASGTGSVTMEGWTYGESANTPTASGTGDVTYLYTGENYSSDQIPTNAGTYTVTATFAETDLYEAAADTATFTIAKASLTITAKDNAITYGDAPSANGVVYSGFVSGETGAVLGGTVVYSYNYQQFGDVGTYKITPAGLTADNYEITFVSGDLTVNPKVIGVLANVVSKTYGDADPELTYQLSENALVNGDTMSGALTRVAGEDVGRYRINLGTLTAGDNYRLTYTDGYLIVNAKPITEADVERNGTLTYTGSEQTQKITVTDGITYTVTGNKAIDAGTYELTVTGTGNYTGEVKLGWSIQKAVAVVGTAPVANTLTYTGEAQALITTGTTADGKLVYSLTEDGQYTETIPTGKNAGVYTVWYYVAGDVNHSDSAKASVSVTISPKAITENDVTLSQETAEFDGKDRTPTVTVTDGAVSLVKNTDYTVTITFGGENVTQVKAEGTYTITIEGKGNYTARVTKTFTVTPCTHKDNQNEVWTPNADGRTHSLSCTVCGKVVKTESHAGGTASCVDKAVCTACGASYGELADHIWSVSYSWSADGKSCTATHVCGSDASHNETATATITSAVSKAPTTTAMGETTYSATFTAAWATAQTKTVADIPMLNEVQVPEVDGGDVSVDNETPATGEDVTVTVTPEPGKEVEDITVTDKDGNEIPVTKNEDGTYTYEQPEGDVTIDVTLKDSEYEVKIPETEGGDVTVDKDSPILGEDVTVTVTPEPGKEVEDITVSDKDGNDIPVTKNEDGTYTYEQPEGDVTIDVTMKDSEYEVKIPETEGGDVTVDKDSPILGEDVTVTVTPEPGKEVEDITVTDKDGNEIPVTKNEDGTYTYEQPEGDVTIDVTMKDSEYEVKIPETEGGDVTVDKDSPILGEDVTVTVTPEPGKEVEDITVTDKDGNEIPVTKNEDGTYTYEQPEGDVTIDVTMKDKLYTVTWTVDGETYKQTQHKLGDTITAPADPAKAQSGCTTYTFTKWDGFTSGMTMPDSESLTFAAVFAEGESHIDRDTNHICDRRCGKTDMGTHADSAEDQDHVCDYGCKAVLEACADVTGDGNHSCDICGKENVTECVGGEARKENEKAATCEESGSYDLAIYCTECSCELSRQTVTVAPIGHSWDEGKVTKAATCTEKGVRTYTCKNDQTHTYTEEIPATGHSHTATVTPPNCTEQGYTTYTCACGDSYVKDYTKPLGHVYTDVWDRLCNVCGEEREIKTTPMYRLYNPNTGEHFYTGSTEERDNLVEVGWNYEGVAWNAPVEFGDPVCRYYNPNTGDHHYTMCGIEGELLVAAGWIYEGVAWNSASPEHLPIYRLYNPNAEIGAHHYTGSEEERDNLVEAGWIYEGIGWYALLY